MHRACALSFHGNTNTPSGRGMLKANPDHEFVLFGCKSNINGKPAEFCSNSMKTTTSRNLSHSQLANHGGTRKGLEAHSNHQLVRPPDKDTNTEDKQSWESGLSLDLRSLNSSLNKSFNLSHKLDRTSMTEGARFTQDGDLQDEIEEELERLIDNELDDAKLESHKDLVGKPLAHSDSVWFTKPLHLTRDAEFPVFEQLGIKEETVSSVKRPTGMTGTEIAQKMIASNCYISDEATKYFPVTLGESFSVEKSVAPSLPSESSANMRRKVSSKTSDFMYDAPTQKATSDYNYFKASQAFLDQEGVATPFQYELAKLKMERLRLEEQRLLSLKRDSELERIRGPEPKWYELKTPKFTYEHSKNIKLVKSENDWQDLLNYRMQLLHSSQKFRTTDDL